MLKKIFKITILSSLSTNAFAIDKEKLIHEFFSETSYVQVCTIPLPVSPSVTLNRLMLGTKHVYLKIDGKTYGTPFTDKKTYWGGPASLYTDDPFAGYFNGQGEKCYNVLYRKTDSEESFIRKASCLADKLSLTFDSPDIQKEWWPIFDYHFLKNNCGSMAKYVVNCIDGRTSKNFNLGVGDDVPFTKKAQFASLDDQGILSTTPTTYGEICKRAISECNEE